MSTDAGQELRGGRYVTTRVLGEGAQGDTLEAIDKSAGKLVAIKRFRVRGARGWKDVELAEREARVLDSLSHPSLPAHIEHFEEGGVLYLVMEKMEGESLGALRKRGAALGRDDVVRFLREASAILDYLHGLAPPVIHRDIKPSNVIRRPDGSFALVDFGAVRDRLKPEGGSTVVGTFGYMAPEQFQGRALPASDVYAVGATALCMLTGSEPENLPHRGLALDVAGALGGRADRALVEVLSAMLEPDPDRRASRIAPLLDRLPARGAGVDERARRDAQGARSPSPSPPPPRERDARGPAKPGLPRGLQLDRFPWVGFPLVAALIGLTVARVAAGFALGVFVPLFLTLLSIVFGRGLREAAASVRASRLVVDRALVRARRLIQEGDAAGSPRARTGARIDVDGLEDERVRVSEPDPRAEPDDAGVVPPDGASRRPPRATKR